MSCLLIIEERISLPPPKRRSDRPRGTRLVEVECEYQWKDREDLQRLMTPREQSKPELAAAKLNQVLQAKGITGVFRCLLVTQHAVVHVVKPPPPKVDLAPAVTDRTRVLDLS